MYRNISRPSLVKPDSELISFWYPLDIEYSRGKRTSLAPNPGGIYRVLMIKHFWEISWSAESIKKTLAPCWENPNKCQQFKKCMFWQTIWLLNSPTFGGRGGGEDCPYYTIILFLQCDPGWGVMLASDCVTAGWIWMLCYVFWTILDVKRRTSLCWYTPWWNCVWFGARASCLWTR